jgi:ABC-type Na+ transport system ATPase subunit NatA
MEAVLTVDGLRKRHRRQDAWAVDGATLAVERVCDTVAIIHKGRLLRVGALSGLVPEGKTLEEVFIDLVQAARSGTA